MSIDYNLTGVRESTSQPVPIRATKEGGLYTAQSLPPYALLTMKGLGWWAQATTAAAGTTTIPTATALGTLWNGSTDKAYVIDRLFANTEAYDALDNFFFLWVCVHKLITTAITADITIHGLRSGDVNYGGQARFDVGATVVNDGWFSVGNSKRSDEANAQGMSNIDYKMEGRIVLPPNGEMSLHVGCNDSNLTAQVGCSWYEVPSDLR